MSFSHKTILVIGLGLIGGSFAKAARFLPTVDLVLGYDLNQEDVELARVLGVIDEPVSDLNAAVEQADLILIAVPVKAIDRVLEQIRPFLRPDAVITDVGSTKASVIAAARRVWGDLPSGFVPGHPIAGAEKSGVAAADPSIFQHRKVILTPIETVSEDALRLVARLWQSLGSEVLQMDPERHDEVLAATSHLPHLLAFSLVDTLAAEAESTDIFRYAAGGFRDFTRIAASDPVMWHDVCFANRTQLLNQIDRFSEGLSRLRTAIDQGDSQALTGIFTRAKASREHFTRILERAGYGQLPSDTPDLISLMPTDKLTGNLRAPGDRSISHRAVILAAIAQGVSDIDGIVESEDSLATIQVFRDLGVVIEGPHQGRVRVYGVGLEGLQKPNAPLYFGNSITSLKLLTGLLAAQNFDSELTGGDQLLKQDLSDLIEPLTQMGAKISDTEGSAPLHIGAVRQLQSINYSPSHSSAQIKSALMLAALSSNVELDLYEPNTTRDHSERLMLEFGALLNRHGRHLRVPVQGGLKARDLQIPADLSLAMGFVIAATLVPGSAIKVESTGVNPTRMQTIRLLSRMGARIEVVSKPSVSGEPVADLMVEASTLVGIDCASTELTGVGDELPLLMVAMAFAQTPSQLIGIDRLPQHQIALVEDTLEQLGKMGLKTIKTDQQIDLFPQRLEPADELDAQQHPMLVMAFLVVGLVTKAAVRVRGCRELSRVFPEYEEQARRIGIRLMKES